jgi:hypothetical protein
MYRICTLFAIGLVTLMILSSSASPLAAQENSNECSRNAIFVEGFGPGLLYSINYDRRLFPDISVRAGVSYWVLPGIFFLVAGGITIWDFPITVNYLIGKDASHIELGIGAVPAFASLHGHELLFGEDVSGSAIAVYGTGTIAYRFQPNEGGIFFRIGFTPIFTFKDFVPWGGISFGGTF